MTGASSKRFPILTVWLDRGQSRRLNQGFAFFEAWRDKVLEEEEIEQHKFGKEIEREEHWLRYGVTARRKRNMRRLGALQDLRAKHRGHNGPQGSVQATVSDARESGKLVIEADADHQDLWRAHHSSRPSRSASIAAIASASSARTVPARPRS